jgi:hypothetical protein
MAKQHLFFDKDNSNAEGIGSFCFIYWRDVVLGRNGEVELLIVFLLFVSLSLSMGRLQGFFSSSRGL